MLKNSAHRRAGLDLNSVGSARGSGRRSVDDVAAMSGIRVKQAVIAYQMGARARHQSGKAGDEVGIFIAETAQVLTVPSSALFDDKGATAVFQFDNGKATLRHVKVGANNGLDVEIVSGLDAGMRVIIHPSDEVLDGESSPCAEAGQG